MATEEDLLAAEWESVSDSSTDDSNQPANEASSGDSEPVLNQDEIDSLLGLEPTVESIEVSHDPASDHRWI